MHVVLEADSVGQEVALPPPRDRRPTTRQPYLAELSSPGRERACTRSRPRCGEKRPAGGQKWYTEALVVSLCFRSLHSYKGPQNVTGILAWYGLFIRTKAPKMSLGFWPGMACIRTETTTTQIQHHYCHTYCSAPPSHGKYHRNVLL